MDAIKFSVCNESKYCFSWCEAVSLVGSHLIVGVNLILCVG